MMDGQMIEVDVIETWWDYLLGISTMMLAAINVWLIYYIYKWQHKDTAIIEERQRKVSQFNNIFLIPRMNILKETFDGLIIIAAKFENSVDDEDKKTEFYNELDNKIVEFDETFVSFIAGIDSTLYEEVYKIVEDMRDGLTQDVFDTNTHEISGSAYVQKIQKKINANYKNLLKSLFGYDGNLKDKNENSKKGSTALLFAFLGIIIILLGSLVYRNYNSVLPEKITFQLDSAQMKKMIDAVKNDTITISADMEDKNSKTH